ncbi:hypothetical protein BHM03_00056517 [Ensete ventricosum]|nr:hypothetical protein BHM03_00056517 [Ensete ventricosum]
MARAPAGATGCSQGRLQGRPPVRGQPPIGIAAFRVNASLQGRHLWAQRPQELPPKGLRHSSAHWGNGACRKGGRRGQGDRWIRAEGGDRASFLRKG